MKIFFADRDSTPLAAEGSLSLIRTKDALLKMGDIEETYTPEESCAIILQEENSYKNFRYIDELRKDQLISKYAHKIFTINDDDCATGLLRGLYTSLPSYRFRQGIHIAVPYMQFPNELVFSNVKSSEPEYLASWRGNTKSNRLRLKLIDALAEKSNVVIERTNSWLNHDLEEKATYVQLIQKSHFSLCPAGWAPVSFRIYESMALARCPVIIADSFVPPNGPKWEEFALFYPESKVDKLHAFLRQNEAYSHQLGLNAYKSWQRHFSPEVIGNYYAFALISLIKAGVTATSETEFKRWKSLQMHWKNEWTVPQRILNKARKLRYG
jgi:hypothetical protein